MGRTADYTVKQSGGSRSHREVVENSISKKMLEYYEIEIKKHKAGGFEWSVRGLKEHLLHENCRLSKEQATRLVNAYRFDLRRRELPPMDAEDHEVLTTYVRGLNDVRDLEEKMPKGAITLKMLREMKGALGTLNVRRFKAKVPQYTEEYLLTMYDDFVIAWITGLRSGQMATLRRSDFSQKDGKWRCTVEKFHDPHAKKKDRKARTSYDIIHTVPWATEVLDARLEDLNPSDLVCPMWRTRHADYSLAIKKIGEELRWHVRYGVRVNGVHCLRHGAGGYVQEKFGKIAAAEFLNHSYKLPSMSVTQRYTLPNSARAKKVATGTMNLTADDVRIHEEEKAAATQSRKIQKKIKQTKKAKKSVKPVGTAARAATKKRKK
jgi:integrase